MTCFKLENRNNIWFGSFYVFEQLGVGNAFSCRLHGESTVVEGSLNLALHVGDDSEAVLKNRRAFADILGVDSEKFTACEQVHGSEVVCVTQKFVGSGAVNFTDTVKGADALITNLPNVPLILFFADCVPLIFADAVTGAIGIAHGGWRGTVAEIATKTVSAMMREFGSKAEDIIVGIGPSIGECCFEVDDAVYSQVEKYKECFIKQDNGKYMMNLQLWNEKLLVDAGIKPYNIYQSGICTKCNNELFFSYRAESGKTGRMGVAVWKR